MIDFTNRETLITVKTALIRAMNSLDNEIADTDNDYSSLRGENKLRILMKSRDDMRALYNEIDAAIIAATR